ncbi:hypothetical protein E4U14_001105, partial [Claviceps sp. LM454 group G7]
MLSWCCGRKKKKEGASRDGVNAECKVFSDAKDTRHYPILAGPSAPTVFTGNRIGSVPVELPVVTGAEWYGGM